MDGRTAGTNRYGTERGTDFWYGILFGTVPGTEYGTDNLDRYGISNGFQKY